MALALSGRVVGDFFPHLGGLVPGSLGAAPRSTWAPWRMKRFGA